MQLPSSPRQFAQFTCRSIATSPRRRPWLSSQHPRNPKMIKQPKAGEREVRTLKTTEFRIATAEDGSRTLSGLIPYNAPSCDLGGFTELIAPSAFAGALAPGADVLCLRDHLPELLMGRTKSKTLSL